MNNKNCVKIILIILLISTIRFNSYSQKKQAIISYSKRIWVLSPDIEDEVNKELQTFKKWNCTPLSDGNYIIPKWQINNTVYPIGENEILEWSTKFNKETISKIEIIQKNPRNNSFIMSNGRLKNLLYLKYY